jgi:uncharacterized membrane protein
MDEFKRFFMRGLAALAPTLLTIALLTWAFRFVDQNIGQHITDWVVAAYAWGGPPHKWLGVDEKTALELGDPINEWDRKGRQLTVQYKIINQVDALTALPKEEKERRGITQGDIERANRAKRDALWELAVRKWKFFNFIGFLIGIALIYFVGYFLASFMGRRTWSVVETGIQRIPVINAIYPNIKQVTDLLISDKKLEFAGVVAVQYPRKGIWSVGLVTGAPMKQLGEHDPRALVTVFIPSSPTPFTGYTITVAREDVLELPLTIDEALRYTVSGGVVKPGEAPSGRGRRSGLEAH